MSHVLLWVMSHLQTLCTCVYMSTLSWVSLIYTHESVHESFMSVHESTICVNMFQQICVWKHSSRCMSTNEHIDVHISVCTHVLIWTSLDKSWQTSIYVSVDTHRNMYVNMYILTYIFQTTVSTDTYMDVLSTFVQRCSNGCKWVHSHECTWLVRKIGREDQSISGVMGCNISAVRACMYICQEQCIYASICRRRYVQYMTNGVRIFWCMFGCIYVNMSLQMYTWVYVCPYMSIIYGSIYLCQHISTALYMDALISMYVNKCTCWRTYFNMCQ